MINFGEKEAWAYLGVSRECPNFLGTPYYLRNGKNYGFQIWLVHSEGPSEQKYFTILEKKERGHIQGLPNFLGTVPRLSQERVKLQNSNFACRL